MDKLGERLGTLLAIALVVFMAASYLPHVSL